MKFLMIANSFGVNLQTFAKQIAEENGHDLDIYVLFIGGCSLQTHINNIRSDAKLYELFHNGESTHEYISIKEALEKDNWDVISLQQASHLCGYESSYYPYFGEVLEYAKSIRPNSKYIFHKTWSYSPINSYKFETVPEFCPTFDFKNAKEMKAGLDYCCDKVCKEYGIKTIIRSGDVVEKATKEIGDCYDAQGFHLNELGCYLIGCHLVKTLFDAKLTKAYKAGFLGKSTCENAVNFINENF